MVVWIQSPLRRMSQYRLSLKGWKPGPPRFLELKISEIRRALRKEISDRTLEPSSYTRSCRRRPRLTTLLYFQGLWCVARRWPKRPGARVWATGFMGSTGIYDDSKLCNFRGFHVGNPGSAALWVF